MFLEEKCLKEIKLMYVGKDCLCNVNDSNQKMPQNS